MPQNDDGEMTPYQNMLNTQIQAELNELGLTGVPWEDVPDSLFEDALKRAEEIVGPNPNAHAE